MNDKQQITYRSVDSLIPYARNTRTHDDAQVAQIAASVREFGWTNPILIDGENGIIAGHGRVLAARKLGMDEVPCIELAGLTDTQRQAYIIADNKLALNAGWDDELLKIEFDVLEAEGFDLELTGFTLDELDEIAGKPEELKEKTIHISPIKWTRILVSVPVGVVIDGIDDVLKKIKDYGGQVDFGGN